MQKITLNYVKIITVSEKYNKKCMHYGFYAVMHAFYVYLKYLNHNVYNSFWCQRLRYHHYPNRHHHHFLHLLPYLH